MVRSGRRGSLALLVIALAVAGACKSKPAASIDEMFTARTQGQLFLQRGQLPEAEAQFLKLVEWAPKEALGFTNLGLVYLQEGRYKEAEKQLERAHELDAGNSDVDLMLAKLYSLTGRVGEAVKTLEAMKPNGPNETRRLHALADLAGQSHTRADSLRREALLTQIVALKPANIVVRLELAAVAVRRGVVDSTLRQLEDIRRIPPGPPKDVVPLLEATIQQLRTGTPAAAQSAFDRFREAMEVTAQYQVALQEVTWIEAPLAGRAALAFEPQSLITFLGSGFNKERTTLVKFVDFTSDAGLPEPRAAAAGTLASPTSLALGDINGDGYDEVLAGSRLFHLQRGYASDMTAHDSLGTFANVAVAAFGDFDNDGWTDLFLIADGKGRLLRNSGAGTFVDATPKAGFDVQGATKAVWVDLDHDGDLDLVLVGNGRRLVYRNNMDGTFTESAAAMGITGTGDARSLVFGDFDGDGRIDLFLTNATGSDVLYRNAGGRTMTDATAASGLTTTGGSGAAAVGDYDNDGLLDLFVSRVDGGEPTLWHNKGDGTFTRDVRSTNALRKLRGVVGRGAEFVDIDNDGWLDLVVAGTPTKAGERGVFLFHNDGTGTFTDQSALLPASLMSATSVATSDVDGDGDEDLLFGVDGGVRLLRNEGGNGRMSTRIQLFALKSGSGKNNSFGIGSRIELRAGELYQTRVVTDRATVFGLGKHLKADVVHIEWPNGVPQSIHFPGTDQDVLELETLKGSCAFLYAWNGERFDLVTDVMWRSALGMPLGMMGGGNMAYAPAGASQEYLRIAGSALKPRDGRYTLQLTEELWETAYADQLKLLAVDHPDSVEVFVDERFVPPAPVSLRLYKAVHPHAPLSAVDERGNDVLPALRARDNVYVSNLTPLEYQGVVQPHDLVLDLDRDAGRAGTYLFLRGWIYPTDASINVALSQQSKVKLAMPSLEVRDAKGKWVTAIANLGFPSGKDKTMIVDLAGKFPTADHHVRIRTNMQIYWDQAFVSNTVSSAPVKVTDLTPLSADLHYRGYSRTFRKGGRYGPWWFAYGDVSTESPWRPITGAFTRFGDVMPLLRSPDDMYVIMAPGDEATLQFDAASADSIPKGWTRDFLLYTDGWIKDSDLNTAHGTTVGPLPFHRIKDYPYAAGEAYPTDSAHQRYQRDYNTRVVRSGAVAKGPYIHK